MNESGGDVKVPDVPRELQPDSGSVRRDLDDASLAQLRTLGTRTPLSSYLREMWERREFATTVPLGQLAAKNQDTALGAAWNLLNPLLLIGVYYVIFQVILGIEERRGVEDYLSFLTVGVIAYNYTRSSVHGGALTIVKNRQIVSTLYFPRGILPVSAMIAQTTSHLYAVVPMLGILLLTGVSPSWSWLLLIPATLVHLVLNLGLAFFVARITFHFRDFEKLLPYLLRLGLYASGVLIPINAELIPQTALRTVLELNPVYLVIEITRQALLTTPLEARPWGLAVAWAGALVVLGFLYFRRAENSYGRV